MWSSISKFFGNIFGGGKSKPSTPESEIQAFKAQVAARLSTRPQGSGPHHGRRGDRRPPREDRGPKDAFIPFDRPPRRPPAPPRDEPLDPSLLELFKPKKLEQPEESEPRTPFAEMPIEGEIQSVLRELGFEHATPVQKAAIPDALAKRNLIVSAMTGSGKTLAFVIPMIQRLKQGEIHQALILSPTREIAIQTHKAMEPFFQKVGLSAALCIGGTDMSQQKQQLRQYPPIIVATPGRLCDMMSQGLVWLNYTDYVVLDEADRMLDMGFEEELMKIHKDLPGTQQVLLFTATLMPEVLRVAEKYGSDYAKHVVGKTLTPADTISHFVVPVAMGRKFQALLSVLRMHEGRTIIFFNTIKDVIHFTNELKRSGFMDCAAIHSGKTQEQRNQSIMDLREGRTKALLGTDVAARGIDIPQVELVINFDLPNNSEEYIHRIGRTGRAGYTGTALSFLGPKDGMLLESIESILKTPIPRETRFPFALKDGEDGGHDEEGRPRGHRPHGDLPRPHGPQGGRPRHRNRGPRREGGAPPGP